jgi:hypothetical protein
MPEWHVTVTGPPPSWAYAEPPVRWPADAVRFGLTTAFVALSGAVAGIIWAQLAPMLSIAGLARGSESPFRALIGADAWFLLVTAIAGVVTAVIALVVRADGPGVTAGLAAGGVLAALIADRVGYLTQHDDVLAMLRHLGISLSLLQQAHIDPFLRVRALGVLMAWPLAAVLVHTGVVALLDRRH